MFNTAMNICGFKFTTFLFVFHFLLFFVPIYYFVFLKINQLNFFIFPLFSLLVYCFHILVLFFLVVVLKITLFFFDLLRYNIIWYFHQFSNIARPLQHFNTLPCFCILTAVAMYFNFTRHLYFYFVQCSSIFTLIFHFFFHFCTSI